MKRIIRIATLLLFSTAPLCAVDPPHEFATLPDDPCQSCHETHGSLGNALTDIKGNDNLCLSCHVVGGDASALPFADADQANPAPPTATPSGTSHRWDSGPSGWVEVGGGNSSPGTVASGGVFNGRYPKTYTITIDITGDVGTARFDWVATTPGGGSGSDILTVVGVAVALDEGVTVTFTDATPSPSFVAGDQWLVHVRTDLVLPTAPKMLVRLSDGKAVCSTCHNQHNQSKTPFDSAAPAYGGSGTGAGRHFMRVDNDADQMCVDCHSPRDVATSAGGSHPVGVGIPGGEYQSPTVLPLDTNNDVACLTCHQPHYSPTSDGTLARLADQVALCSDCHTLAAASASHLDDTTGVLWPGGEYGSNFPVVTDSGKTGACSNCHQPHGWPDAVTPANDYPTLLVETPSELCHTCHDGTPASDEWADFSSTQWVTAGAGLLNNEDLNNHHDVLSTDQLRSETDLACSDCHDPHTATPTAKVRPDPDTGDGRDDPALEETWTGSDTRSEWCLDCHDGSLPAGVTPPTTALTNVRTTYLTNDQHGTIGAAATLRSGYGWAADDEVPCTACHVGGPYSPPNPAPNPPAIEHKGHGSTNLFQLRTTVFSKDGLTAIPSDCGGTTVTVTNNNVKEMNDPGVNGYCFCNTCHTGSMGTNQTNCFSSNCHVHGGKF